MPKRLLSDVIVNVRVFWFDLAIRIPAREAGFIAANRVKWYQGQDKHSQICSMLGIGTSDITTVKEVTGTNKGPITCTTTDDVYKYAVNTSSTKIYFSRRTLEEIPDTPSHYINVYIRRPSSCYPYGYTVSVNSDLSEYNGILLADTSNLMWFKVKTSDGRYFWIIPTYHSGTSTYVYLLNTVYVGDFTNGDYGHYVTSSTAKPEPYTTEQKGYWNELSSGIPLTWVDVFFPYGKPSYTTVTINEIH